MKHYYCMPQDSDNYGPPWLPLQTRHIDTPPVWEDGWAGIMVDIEGTHHWNLRPAAKGTPQQAQAIDFFKAFIYETRAACPEGTPIGAYSVPCYWGYDWETLEASAKDAIDDHWIGVVGQIGVDVLMPQCYLQAPDVLVNIAGKLSISAAVTVDTGKPTIAVVTHRAKGTDPGDMGRILIREEVDPLLPLLRSYADGVYHWHGDDSGIVEACVPDLITPEARAARRKDMKAELFGDGRASWLPSSAPRLRHIASANRRVFAGWLYYGTKVNP